MTSYAIEAEGLRKRFGTTQALDGVSLQVPAGRVLGVLGPNGAGKTTAVRILATLLTPDEGTARIGGLDVVRDAARVRRSIGLTGQYASVDEDLTGMQNLLLIGTLLDLSRRDARRRATELSSGSTWPTPPPAPRAPTPAACAAASTSRPPSSAGPRSCSSTNRPPGSTPPSATPCGTSSAPSSARGPPCC